MFTMSEVEKGDVRTKRSKNKKKKKSKDLMRRMSEERVRIPSFPFWFRDAKVFLAITSYLTTRLFCDGHEFKG